MKKGFLVFGILSGCTTLKPCDDLLSKAFEEDRPLQTQGFAGLTERGFFYKTADEVKYVVITKGEELPEEMSASKPRDGGKCEYNKETYHFWQGTLAE